MINTKLIMRLRPTIVNLMRSTPLAHKAVLLTVVVGIIIMAVVDNFMAFYLQKDLQAKLSEELYNEAIEDLVNFDHYVDSHRLSAQVLISRTEFNEFSRHRQFKNRDQIIISTKPPAWMPSTNELELFPNVQYALFFDGIGKLEEVFQNSSVPAPKSLRRQAAYLLKQSNSRTMLAKIAGVPYLLASQSLTNNKKQPLAAIMLASRIDENFLFRAMGPLSQEHIIALLADDQPIVRTSSHPDLLPAGQLLDQVNYRYKALDLSSFDITAADINSRFAAIISTHELTNKTQEILSLSRRHRFSMALMIILACASLIYWISRYIHRLSDDLLNFGNHALGISEIDSATGDELYLLKKQFHKLTEEVVRSHEVIRREASELSRIIVNNANEAIITFNEVDRITSWNPAAEVIFGWPSKDVIGKDLTKILAGPESENLHFLLANRALGHGKQLEMNVLHQNGHEFPVEFMVSNIDIKDRKNFIAFARDISKRKKNEQDIRDAYINQKILSEILHISLAPISLAEQLQRALGHILTMNRINLLGQGVIFLADNDKQELAIIAHQGLSIDKTEKCAQVKFGHCFCGRAAENGQIEFTGCIDERHDIKFTQMLPHGHYCVPIISTGRVLGVLGLYVPSGHERKKEEEDILMAIAHILAGIIERQRMEDKLVSLVEQQKASIKELDGEKKFSGSIVRSLSSGLMVLDLQDKIIAANPIGTQIFADMAGELYNNRLTDIVGPEAAELMTRIDADNPSRNDEIVLSIAPGNDMILSFTSTYREDAEGQRVGIIISFTDITQIKQIQNEMEKMNRLSTVAELASAVAHEVRNPLAGIKTMSQAIEENLNAGDDNKEYISRIIKQVDRLNKLLTEFFTYARPAKPKKIKTSLVDIINETKPLINSRLNKNRIALNEDYQPDLPPIIADPNQTQQVFLNLMLNAIDAIETDGDIAIAAQKLTETELSNYCLSYPALNDAGQYVAVTFKDNGPGMAEEVADRAFEPFYTTKHTGSGLGLAIVHRILDENNAAIYLDCSGKDDGTCFIMFFEA